MEPFSLAIIAATLLKSFADAALGEVGRAAGKQVGDLLFPRTEGTPEQMALSAVAQGRATSSQEVMARLVIQEEVERDPALAQRLEETIRQAVKADPSLARLFPIEPHDVEADLRRAAQRGDGQAAFDLGILLRDSGGRVDEARAAFIQATRLAPGNVASLAMLALASLNHPRRE
jgi:Flp pilus assembly protein TadD